MKSWLFWLVIAAAVFGAWWVFFRRRPTSPAGGLGLVAAGPGMVVDDVSAFLGSLGQPTPPGGLPPVAPSSSPSITNQAINAWGDISQQTFSAVCKAGAVCNALAPGANLAGKAAAAIPIKSTEYAYKGVKAVGKGAVSLVRKIF